MANRIRWRARSNIATHQYVYRSIDPFDLENVPEPIATVGPEVEYYVDADALADVRYYYMVGSANGSVVKYSRVVQAHGDVLDLGPGPQVPVAHNERNGFLGEVTSSQFITGQDLASLVGLTDGILQNSTTPWLKFFYNGEIVFIPKKNIRHSATWDHLQAVNVVDGSRVIDIQGYQFRIELIEGITRTPPAEAITSGYDVPWSHGSMWNELMYYVSQEHTNAARHKLSQIGDNWANYPQDDSTNGLNITAGNGRYSWCKETHPTQPTTRVLRGEVAVSYLGWADSSSVNANRGWRPALFLNTL